MDNTLIKVAAVRKFFNTIGSLRFACIFQATDGNWLVDNIRSEHKTEASARKKLEKLCAKHGNRFAPSFVKES